MKFKCTTCGDTFYYSEEVNIYNCNGELVSSSEHDLERNSQNPDYVAKVICVSCDEQSA